MSEKFYGVTYFTMQKHGGRYHAMISRNGMPIKGFSSKSKEKAKNTLNRWKEAFWNNQLN